MTTEINLATKDKQEIIQGVVETLESRLTAGRASNLDNLDATVSSRASSTQATNILNAINSAGGGGEDLAQSIVAGTIGAKYVDHFAVSDMNKMTGQVLRVLIGEHFEPHKGLETMNAVLANETAMNAVFASETAVNAVTASETAMNAIMGSSVARRAIHGSSIAENAIRNSTTARNVLNNYKITDSENRTFRDWTNYKTYSERAWVIRFWRSSAALFRMDARTATHTSNYVSSEHGTSSLNRMYRPFEGRGSHNNADGTTTVTAEWVNLD